MDEVEVLNGTLRAGDRVAVAVNSRGPSMRVGTVLEILPGVYGWNQRYGQARVKVRVDQASGMTGQHFNYEDQRWEFKPFVKVYDDPRTMVKLEGAADCLAALKDATEGMEDMIGYVPEYFQEKWDHRGYVDRAKAALASLGEGQ